MTDPTPYLNYRADAVIRNCFDWECPSSSPSWIKKMGTNKAFSWQALLKDVLQETDEVKLSQKVDGLEAAIFFRFQELQNSPDGALERAKLNDAASTLLDVKVQKLGFPISGLPSFRRLQAK